MCTNKETNKEKQYIYILIFYIHICTITHIQNSIDIWNIIMKYWNSVNDL